MKKAINKTYWIVALLFAFIACLTGATMLSLSANAQEEEPKSTVEFTSYTSVLKVDEEFEFAALVTNEDGTTSTEVTWSSSDEDVIFFEEGGLAYANAEGNATITATATDGASASVDVVVSNSAIHVLSIEAFPMSLELGVDWTLRMDYTILPQDAYDQSATWTSDNPAVVTVDANGNVKAIAEGEANLTVTASDAYYHAAAKVPVKVYAGLEEATISPDTYAMNIGDHYDLTLTLPEGVSLAAETIPSWYSFEDSVASVDRIEDTIGTVFAWGYGTTTIYAVAHGSDGKVYGAMATIHVSAEFYYLTGLYADLSDPEGNPWVTYDTAEDAQKAGVLLAPTEKEYVYALTRTLWAYDYFQIIHENMEEDPDWVTKITSTSFSEEGSTMAYVANTVDSFGVNSLGQYTITLDLSSGRAKVTIEMVDLVVTDLNITAASENTYLQFEGPEGAEDPAAAQTMLLNVETLPEDAKYNMNDVVITVPADVETLVSAQAIQTEEGALQIKLTQLKEQATTQLFDLGIKVENATATVTVTILGDGLPFAAVEDVAFGQESYILNVNNGAKPWNTPISASVTNDNASVKDISYSSENDHLWFEVIDGQTYAHADALGTYTIKATSLSDPTKSDTATVLVTSLVGTAPDYTTGFYLIGELGGHIIENWTSIPPTETTFGDSQFANWTLPLQAGQNNVYTTTVHLNAYDRFSIAFLGMDGNWGGIIDANYMDWPNSKGDYYESDGNVQTTVAGEYTITLYLNYERPYFVVDLKEKDDTSTYTLGLYIVKAGDTWDPNEPDSGNILATVGYIEIVNGVAQSVTLTLDKFTIDAGTEPVIQFVTARGIEGGYFYGETWYGESYTDIVFGGNSYSVTATAGCFTRSHGNSVLYWVADTETATVTFKFTFNTSGVLTNVDVNPATTEVPAE